MSTQKKELFKNIIHFSFGSIFSVLIGFAATPISTRLISPDQFGHAAMFSLAITLSVFFVLFGFDQAFIRFFYEEDEKARGKLLYVTLMPSLCLFLILFLLVAIFYKRFFLLILGDNTPKFSYVYIFAIGVILQVLQWYALLIVRMQKKGKIYSLLQVNTQIINLSVIVGYCWIFSPSFFSIVYAQILSSFVIVCLGIGLERKFWCFWKMEQIKTRNTLNSIFKIGSPLVINSLLIWLFESIDRLGLRYWSSFQEVGIYAASFKIIACMSIFQNIFTTVWPPIAYEHYEKDRENSAFVKDFFDFIFLLMAILSVLLIIFRSIIILLLGPKYAACMQIFPFLVFVPFMYTVSAVSGIGIDFSKKVWWHLLLSVIALLVNSLLIFLLVPHFGGRGAAISTGVAYVVFFLIKTKVASRYYNLHFSYAKNFVILFAISMYAMYGTFFYHNNVFDVIIGVMVVGIIILINFGFIRRFYSFAVGIFKKQVS